VQEELRHRGHEVSARYLPAQILPQWDTFLASVVARRGSASGRLVVTAPHLQTKSADAAEET
jgi:hypothetical protein